MKKNLLTLDQLLEALQQQKTNGVPGDILVAVPASDNNGRGGYIECIEGVGQTSVAKADMDKGFSLMRVVSSRGVPVLVLR